MGVKACINELWTCFPAGYLSYTESACSFWFCFADRGNIVPRNLLALARKLTRSGAHVPTCEPQFKFTYAADEIKMGDSQFEWLIVPLQEKILANALFERVPHLRFETEEGRTFKKHDW